MYRGPNRTTTPYFGGAVEDMGGVVHTANFTDDDRAHNGRKLITNQDVKSPKPLILIEHNNGESI